MTRAPLVAVAASLTLATSLGAGCGTSRATGPAADAADGSAAATASRDDDVATQSPLEDSATSTPASASPEGASSREFQLQKSDTAKHAQGERPSAIAPSRTHAAVRFFVVDPDAGPIPGIVIKMTAPDGSRYFTGETDAQGYGEVLVPIGQRYEIEYLSLGRRNVTAHVDVPSKPNQNLRLTLRYRPWRGASKASASKAGAPTGGAQASAATEPSQEHPSEPQEPQERFVLEGVVFPSGSAKLDPASFPRLDSVVEYMTHKPSARIQVSGHTDNVGDPRKNLALSEARAKSVRDYLVSKGIAPERIDAVGYGDTRPVASNDNEKGRAQNRRIEAVEIPAS